MRIKTLLPNMHHMLMEVLKSLLLDVMNNTTVPDNCLLCVRNTRLSQGTCCKLHQDHGTHEGHEGHKDSNAGVPLFAPPQQA